VPEKNLLIVKADDLLTAFPSLERDTIAAKGANGNATVETYGGLHFAFNNAGILPATALLADVDEAAFDQVVAVDLKGVFLAMKYEIQYMLKAGGGAIVNNASIAGMIADPGISAYVAAKHAVIGLSKAAGIEYASQGIRINALAPGLMETGMTRHWFEDDEIHSARIQPPLL